MDFDFWQFYYNGGWFMDPILLLGLGSATSGLLALIVRRYWAAFLALVFAALCLGLGYYAYKLYMAMALETLQSIVPEQYDEALAASEESSRIPLYFGAACALPGFLGGLVALIGFSARQK